MPNTQLNCVSLRLIKRNAMNRIKEFWGAKSMSAHRLDKSFNMVNPYASNKVQPPIPVLYEIANILKVDMRELLTPNNYN